jgi:hypothetical protein
MTDSRSSSAIQQLVDHSELLDPQPDPSSAHKARRDECGGVLTGLLAGRGVELITWRDFEE